MQTKKARNALISTFRAIE